MTNRLSAILTSESTGTRKTILNFTLRGVTLATGHWLTFHSFTLALAKWACSRIFRRMYHFYRPVLSINSFCLVADLSCNWPVTIGNKCYISHNSNGVYLPVGLYWYTGLYKKRKTPEPKQKKLIWWINLCFMHFPVWNDSEIRSYIYYIYTHIHTHTHTHTHTHSPTESPFRASSMCLIMASRSLSCDTQEWTRSGWNTPYVPSGLLYIQRHYNVSGNYRVERVPWEINSLMSA